MNAAFLATLYGDYLETADSPGWYCGPNFYPAGALRDFARTQVLVLDAFDLCYRSVILDFDINLNAVRLHVQIDYILGKNPHQLSYVVGFGTKYPKHVHHRGASIPKNRVHYNCKGGWKWRDTRKPNPNTIAGAMVAGPDRHDEFRDVRSNRNCTEPTLAGNAGLVAALVALSGGRTGVDKNTMFSSVPPMFPNPPPPPAPWKP